jgi:hypothetical protein
MNKKVSIFYDGYDEDKENCLNNSNFLKDFDFCYESKEKKNQES